MEHLIDIKVTEYTNALKRFKLDDEIINALATLTCTHFVSNISLSNYLLFYYFTIISQKINSNNLLQCKFGLQIIQLHMCQLMQGGTKKIFIEVGIIISFCLRYAQVFR